MLITIRPWQWIKNGLLFVPLVFAMRIGELSETYLACLAFSIFCLVSSSVYCMNDAVDFKNDSRDEVNKLRPVASGLIGRAHAVTFSISLLLVGIVTSYILVSPVLTGIVCTYYLMNLLYSIYFKQVIQLGALLVSLGFVLRVYAGAFVISVEVSSWLVLVTFFTAMFISLMKIRQKCILKDSNAPGNAFFISYLGSAVNITAGLVMVLYCLWVILGQQLIQDQRMLISVPFVVYGIFRIIFLMYENQYMRDPTTLLFKDKPLLITFGLWLASCLVALYFNQVIGYLTV